MRYSSVQQQYSTIQDSTQHSQYSIVLVHCASTLSVVPELYPAGIQQYNRLLSLQFMLLCLPWRRCDPLAANSLDTAIVGGVWCVALPRPESKRQRGQYGTISSEQSCRPCCCCRWRRRAVALAPSLLYRCAIFASIYDSI